MSARTVCSGCGESFDGTRGLRAHQSARFVTMACRPVPAPVTPEYVVRKALDGLDRPAGWDVLLIAGDRTTWCQRFPTRTMARESAAESNRVVVQ